MIWSTAVKFGLAAIAILILGLVAVAIFDAIWFRVGFGAAVLVLVAVLLGVAWSIDRRERQQRDVDGLPRV